MVAKKRHINIQVVCGVGMGSSLMAKMTIEQVASSMGVRVNAECANPGVAGGRGVDIIATTPFLADKLGDIGDTRVVVFTNFINEQHIREKLEPIFKELLGE